MRVLVVWPDDYDRACFTARREHEYVFADNGPSHWIPDPTFHAAAYLDRCLDVARRHRVEAVLSTHDLGDLVAALVARELGLPGPDPEAVFTCLHKFYARRREAHPVACTPVPLGAPPPAVCYPAFVKAPWLKLGLLGFKVRDHDELSAALALAVREYPRWARQYYPLFERVVDAGRYPLATTDMMLVEEFITGDQVTVEGWVQRGRVDIWAITDTNTHAGGRVIDSFTCPSRLPTDLQAEVAAYAATVVARFGLSDTFFNLEVWLTDDGPRLTEVNGRAAVCFNGIYGPALGASIFSAVADVACGRRPRERPRPTGVVAGQFNLISHRSGRAGDAVDFTAAATFPCLRLFRRPDEHVTPVSEFGVVLGQLELVGATYEEIRAQADLVRGRVLRQPDAAYCP